MPLRERLIRRPRGLSNSALAIRPYAPKEFVPGPDTFSVPRATLATQPSSDLSRRVTPLIQEGRSMMTQPSMQPGTDLVELPSAHAVEEYLPKRERHGIALCLSGG